VAVSLRKLVANNGLREFTPRLCYIRLHASDALSDSALGKGLRPRCIPQKAGLEFMRVTPPQRHLRVSFRVSVEERQYLDAKAKRSALTLSDYRPARVLRSDGLHEPPPTTFRSEAPSFLRSPKSLRQQERRKFLASSRSASPRSRPSSANMAGGATKRRLN